MIKGVIPIFKLYDEEMNIIDFPEGVIALDIFISSIEKERITDRIESSNATIDLGFTYKDRDIDLKILLKAYDTQDYRLLRDSVYSMFQITDKLYVSEEYQPGKVYLVSINSKYIPERVPNNQRYAEADISCSIVKLPFSESINTTADLDKNGLHYGDGWHYGMGLLYDETSHRYSHNSTTFEIYNAGNVPIHPFEQDLKITIEGASKGYELKNETTGDVFKITDDVSGKVVLNRANITNDGSQALRKTNRKYISLSPGINKFTQNKNAKVSFDFPFYYY